jgi:hypothetical protein
MLPWASRALPCTSASVFENTTFGSGFHSEAHSRSSSLNECATSGSSQ